MSLEQDSGELKKAFEQNMNEKRCPVCGTGMVCTSDDGTPTHKCLKCGHEEVVPYEAKVVEAGTEVETEPAIAPSTPSAPPAPRPSKPISPIKPTPGIQPKPKAENPDVELFLRKRGLTEAKSDLFQPADKDEIERRKELDPVTPEQRLSAELSCINVWMKDTTEAYDDYEWDGNELVVFLDGEANEKYSRADLEEAGVFDHLMAYVREVPRERVAPKEYVVNENFFGWQFVGLGADVRVKGTTRVGILKEKKGHSAVIEVKGQKMTELFSNLEVVLEAQHSHEKCMDCSKPPTKEVLWANGHGHAWFCGDHYTSWMKENGGDVLSVKDVKDGKAATKFADNKNPNLKNESKINEQDPLSGVHPSKREFIETGDETLNKILPELSPEEQRYLKTIASETYQETIRKIQDATGMAVRPTNYPALVQLMFQTLQQAQEIEETHTRRLEEIALDLVFSIPEFKVVEEAYLDDELGFDIKIDNADLTKLVGQEEEPEEGLTQDEELNLALANAFEGMSDEDLRRRFANLLITGGAYDKLHLYNMAREKLAQIDENLPAYYGILASMAQLGYWVMPFGIEQAAAGGEETSAGSEEVVPEGDKYIIKARGTTFPYLVYELIKGIYEYLALDPSQQVAMQKDKLEDETKDMIAGPGVYKAVASYIPADKQELLPIVQKKLTALGADDIRHVLAKDADGKRLMDGLIADAEKELGAYRKQREEYRAA
jgi:hypothetical protein